ncbi:hypothetical protein C8R46DRAFT_1281451 [Mycena filopes]|nr:hypothetical protein C8R46DRAFT_1281451 [Mycena filopes]
MFVSELHPIQRRQTTLKIEDYTERLERHMLATTFGPASYESNLTDFQLQTVARLLSTNDVPLPHEAAIIQIIVDNLTRPGREAEEKTLKEYRAVLHPVRRIPSEILCQIFAWMLPPTQVVQHHTVPVAPWTLGHVCRYWRAVALAHAPLWTSILVYTPRLARSDPGKEMDDACPRAMVETLLHRSGNVAPLDVTILLSPRDGLGGGGRSESLELLCSHSKRWKALRLRPLVSLELLQSVKGQLPILKTLELLHGFSPTGDVFSIAPSLRELHLTNNGLVSPVSLLLPWDQLSHFHGSYRSRVPALDVVELLRITQALVECHLHEDNARVPNSFGRAVLPPVPVPVGMPPVVVPHLHRLNLSGLPQLLQLITAPLLQELWISENATNSLLGFIQRAKCPLITLVVTDCSAPDALIPVLAALSPTLRTFYVYFKRTAPQEAECRLLEALTVAPTSTAAPLCPHLSRLAMGDLSTRALSALLDVADSRASSGAVESLSFLRGFYSGALLYSAMEAQPRVDDMRAAGLDVKLQGEFRPGL